MPACRHGPIQRIVSPAVRLDLHDIGAKITQQLRGGRAHDHGGQVEDPDAAQRAGRRDVVSSGQTVLSVLASKRLLRILTPPGYWRHRD